ncbi:hypothetical protein [Microbacterium paulum]
MTFTARISNRVEVRSHARSSARVEKKASVSKTLRVADKVAKRNAELLRRLA